MKVKYSLIICVLLSLICFASCADKSPNYDENQSIEVGKKKTKVKQKASDNGAAAVKAKANKLGPYMRGLTMEINLNNSEIQKVREIISKYTKAQKRIQSNKKVKNKPKALERSTENMKKEYVKLLGKSRADKKDKFDKAWSNRKK